MSVTSVDLASLLCSRLCHDLLSPVGALNNGLELLADETDPAMRERCLVLLNDSARASAAKLKFFRLAFGAAGGFGEMVDVREARNTIEGLVGENKRITLEWLVEEPALPKAAIKVLLNLVLIGTEAMIRGGTLSIGAEERDGIVEIVVQLAGDRLVMDDQVRETLTSGAFDGATPRAVTAYLVHAVASEAGGSVMLSEPDTGVMVLGAALNAR